MSVSSSEILCLGDGVKQSASFSISISCLVKNMIDKFITFCDIFRLVDDDDGVQQIVINHPRYYHILFFIVHIH